jgi:hypothetical protein
VIGDGNLVELNSSATVAVVFAGPTGTLELDDSSSFSGQISGFFSQDEIDLRDINFATQPMLGYAANDGNTSGTLTVSDGGRDAKIALLGNYMASEFATSSDGHGGTLVTAQPGSSTEQTSLMTPQIHT